MVFVLLHVKFFSASVRRHPAWQYFRDITDKNMVKCITCQKSFSWKKGYSVGKLMNHLAAKHRWLYEKALKDKEMLMNSVEQLFFNVQTLLE